MFDAMLTLACEEALDREYAEAQAYAEANPVIPSEEFHKRMEKLIRGGTGKSAKPIIPQKRIILKAVKKAYDTFSKVAAIILVLVVLVSATAFSVEAVRIEILNFLISIEDEYTSLRLDADKGNNVIGDNLYISWKNAYAPTYIPKGYQIVNITNSEIIRSILLKNDEGMIIAYTEHSDNAGTNLDTENAYTESIKVGDNDALFVEKEGLVSVAWSNGQRIFIITSQLEREELLKVAENVKFISS